MSKKSMLYVSPFQPMKSGISDYSAKLIKILNTKFDITLCVDNYKVTQELADNFPVLTYGTDHIDYDKFDYIVYNIGNNILYHEYIYKMCLAHPGFVILHDMVIFGLFYGFYKKQNTLYQTLYKYLEASDFAKIKSIVKLNSFTFDAISKFPLNKEILESGNKILVHSWYAYNKILETGYIKKENLFKITHIKLDDKVLPRKNVILRENLYRKYNVPQDALVIASFGNIMPTKLNDVVCKVVKNLKNKINKKFCFVLVGEGDAVDNYLTDNLIIKTGYTTIEEFEAFINFADVIVNLRYPSMGETSGAMIRILASGKPCIINPDAWFAEIPEDCVYRVDKDNLYVDLKNGILELLNNQSLRDKISKNAIKYIETEYNDKKILDEFNKALGE